MLAPVVLFVYARPEHTRKTLESLASNSLAEESEVYIFSDESKSEKTLDQVKRVREYVDSLTQQNHFKSIKIIKAETNMGLARSVIAGVSAIVARYGKVIVVEDDLVSAPDFLQYMNDALDYYEGDNRIWSICGYTFKVKIPAEYRSDVYLSYRGGSWGWATWKDRWEKVDWEVRDYREFSNSRTLRSRFNRGGRDMANSLDSQMRGEIDSWAIRWCYAQSKLNMLTVYPTVSRIKNIGLDGTGTHSGISANFDAEISNCNKKCKFEPVNLDARIVKSFRDQFGSCFEHFRMGINFYIKRMLGM